VGSSFRDVSGEEARGRMERVRAVLDGVFAMSAPPAELLAAARQAIEEIDRIASTAADAAEENELLDLCEPLEQIVEELEEVVSEAAGPGDRP
jgi:hypothetical protein